QRKWCSAMKVFNTTASRRGLWLNDFPLCSPNVTKFLLGSSGPSLTGTREYGNHAMGIAVLAIVLLQTLQQGRLTVLRLQSPGCLTETKVPIVLRICSISWLLELTVRVTRK